ncbi:MAG: hypothetical protein GY849_00645 [Deltaproteobacteria bacterium]|nr:hypothetical protein [Deltaproteobacteria bacterium]
MKKKEKALKKIKDNLMNFDDAYNSYSVITEEVAKEIVEFLKPNWYNIKKNWHYIFKIISMICFSLFLILAFYLNPEILKTNISEINLGTIIGVILVFYSLYRNIKN